MINFEDIKLAVLGLGYVGLPLSIEFGKKINTAVFPGVQGGPLMHAIAAKAVAFGLALKSEFTEYQKQVVTNASHFAKTLQDKGYRIVSGGTDTHLFLVDLRSKGISGKEATGILSSVNITVNKNLIPFDPKPPAVASGIRIGTPAITTRGMKLVEMEKIAECIDLALTNKENLEQLEKIKVKVAELTKGFPLYPDLNL